MFLHTKLENRKEPIRIAFVGCGKFVSMVRYTEFFELIITQKLIKFFNILKSLL